MIVTWQAFNISINVTWSIYRKIWMRFYERRSEELVQINLLGDEKNISQSSPRRWIRKQGWIIMEGHLSPPSLLVSFPSPLPPFILPPINAFPYFILPPLSPLCPSPFIILLPLSLSVRNGCWMTMMGLTRSVPSWLATSHTSTLLWCPGIQMSRTIGYLWVSVAMISEPRVAGGGEGRGERMGG